MAVLSSTTGSWASGDLIITSPASGNIALQAGYLLDRWGDQVHGAARGPHQSAPCPHHAGQSTEFFG